MVYQAVVSLLVNLATWGFLGTLGLWDSGLILQLILQMNYQFLIYENDGCKQWFSCSVYDMTLRGWPAQTHLVLLNHFDITFLYFFPDIQGIASHNGMAFKKMLEFLM